MNPPDFHSGTDSYEETHPQRVGNIAKQFPEATVLMIHMGGVGWNDLTSSAIQVAQECPNILLIGSAVRVLKVIKDIKLLGADRVCYASDCPFSLMHSDVAGWKAMLENEVSDEDYNKIMGGNLAQLFNITNTSGLQTV